MLRRWTAAGISLVGFATILVYSLSAAPYAAGEMNAGVFDQLAMAQSSDQGLSTNEGVEPLGKGPVHEAYAEPAQNAVPQPGPVVPKQPPNLIEELPPAEKPDGDNVEWIPGYWAWDEDRNDFIWVSGMWRSVPPGRRWVAGYWKQIDQGYQWVEGYWAQAEAEEIGLLPAPPAPVTESEPPAPDKTSFFVPGHWVYRDSRYVWKSGFWCPFRPGWIWVPAHYVWTPAGYVFVEGYWDRPLQDRGLLFAPVRIAPEVIVRVEFRYTPTVVVHDQALMAALFVRPGYGCYFFGDYFDARYSRLGYQPWVDYRLHRRWYDPLFSYYRRLHRKSHWEHKLRRRYSRCRKGLEPRPPVSLRHQKHLVKKLIRDRHGRDRLKSLVMLGTLNRVNQHVVKTRKLDAGKRGELRQRLLKVRDLAKKRAANESHLAGLRKAGSHLRNRRNRVLKLKLPRLGHGKSGKSNRSLPGNKSKNSTNNLGKVKRGNGSSTKRLRLPGNSTKDRNKTNSRRSKTKVQLPNGKTANRSRIDSSNGSRLRIGQPTRSKAQRSKGRTLLRNGRSASGLRQESSPARGRSLVPFQSGSSSKARFKSRSRSSGSRRFRSRGRRR